MPNVTIIVPVYNVEKYVEKCLLSIVKQTLKDIQIIVVNDGSTDGSKEIINKFLKDERILYLEKENGGLSDARNYAIPYATGKYIGFVDSDDYIELDMFEKMYDKAIEENSDMVECDFYWEYPNKVKKDTGIIYKGKKEAIVNARVVAWNKLIKRELLQDESLRFPKGLRYEDIEFFYKLIPYLNKISFVKEPLVHYIQRDTSIANTQNERTGEIFKVFDNVFDFYKHRGLHNEYKDELEYSYTRILLCSSLKRITHVKDKTIRKRLINETWNNLNTKFPDWKKNKYLNNTKSLKNIYMKTVNKMTFKIYSKII